MLYQSLVDLFSPASGYTYSFFIRPSSYTYSFSRDSLCLGPLPPEAELLWLLGVLVTIGIIVIIEHYDNKDTENKTS